MIDGIITYKQKNAKAPSFHSANSVKVLNNNLDWTEKHVSNEKALRETQILRAGCNLISWRWSLPLPTNPVW